MLLHLELIELFMKMKQRDFTPSDLFHYLSESVSDSRFMVNATRPDGRGTHIEYGSFIFIKHMRLRGFFTVTVNLYSIYF